MIAGRLVQSGGPELAQELEQKGYDWLRQDYINEDLNGSADAEGDEHDHA
jgi:hypothetical protein